MSTKRKPIRTVTMRNRNHGLIVEYLVDGEVCATFDRKNNCLVPRNGKAVFYPVGGRQAELRVADGTIPPHSFFAPASGTLRIMLGGPEYRVELGSRREGTNLGSDIFVGEDRVGAFWIKRRFGFALRAELELCVDLTDVEAVYLAHLINFAPDEALPLLRGEIR